MMMRVEFSYFYCLFFWATFMSTAQEHPNLILTQKGVNEIRSHLGKVPFFDRHLSTVKAEVDAEIAAGVEVPFPKDVSGGYTHQQHKKNFFILQKAGALYQILEQVHYAAYVKEVLMAYAKMYKNLPLHPETRSYARGKLFWQCLNDANWLVYVSQAYDCIYDYLSKKERTYLEKELFRPFADFLSVGNPKFFNRINNHSTWGNAAVGMMGLVMNDEELIQRALYGLKNITIDPNSKDNDGGLIKEKGEKEGFLANIDAPFSPDGYYTEAPYYQRYAMYPFLLFSTGLENARPELKVFEYKNGVLLNAVNSLINLTDIDGEFFPLNDAQKGMSYYSRELVAAIDIAYHYGDKNPQLLSIAEHQGAVTLDDAGFEVAKAIEEGLAKPFKRKSIEFTDGPQGDEGGITVLHNGKDQKGLCLVSKYTAQGNSHGHYDKLSFMLNFKGEEVIQDYGAARFVNISQKSGGSQSGVYLDENFSFAKLTIAHNTLSVDEEVHFGRDYRVASKNHAEKYFSELSNDGHQIISAKDHKAYPGVGMHRTLVMLQDHRLYQPLIIDLFRVESLSSHQYDLPYHYFGQLMSTNFDFQKEKNLSPLGGDNGYEHLWKLAEGKSKGGTDQFTWLYNDNFITLSMANKENDAIIFTQMGASDPNFNLRSDPSVIIRRKNTGTTLFANVIEIHGTYSTVTEAPIQSKSMIQEVSIIQDSAAYTAIRIDFIKGDPVHVILANKDNNKKTNHILNIENTPFKWKGPYFINN